MRADKYKMINLVNLFSAWRNYSYFSLTVFCGQISLKKKKKETFSSLSQLMTPFQQDLIPWLLLHGFFFLFFTETLNEVLAVCRRWMVDNGDDGHDNERESWMLLITARLF